jgi:exopolyphosphatase / guanosine-5'-triphosphate,3'-diphosphate pyrophosphatase
MNEKIAVIDLGTNTFHLLIASIHSGNSTILHREKQAVKIGVGGINQGIITKEGIQRAVSCIRNFKKTLDQWNVTRVQAFGTSALRNAKNGRDVIQKIKSETGIEINLISGDQEAEYIYYGVRSAMDLGLSTSLIIDIGGGSVEFIIGNRNEIFWKQSFEIGAQRLLELYHKHDPILEKEINQLIIHFEKSLEPLEVAIREFDPVTLVGSSGTFDTLSEIYCHKKSILISRDDGETPLTIPDFKKIYYELLSKNRMERMLIPGMIEMRVDMIVVGSCLVNYLIEKYKFPNIRVSTYSLKEGVLTTLR